MTGIKFLKGYGISIRQKNNKVYLTDGADPFTGKRESESYYITNFPYEKIVLCGKGYISTDATAMFLAYGIANAIWIAPTMAGLAAGIYLTKSKWKR